MDDLRYPTGPFAPSDTLTSAEREALIAAVESTPAHLRAAVDGLSDEQLDTPYRPGGWTVRQVVHHVADSHLNSYVRFRWVVTEDNPRIKTYDQRAWAELDDARTAPVEASLRLLEALHERWVLLLRGLDERDFGRGLDHPEEGAMTLDTLLQLYGWHGPHHVAHVKGLRQREGW